MNNDENSKPGNYVDPRVWLETEREIEREEMLSNPKEFEEKMILKIAGNIAARANHQFTPPNENGATDRTSGEMYSIARNMFLSWRDNAAAHLIALDDPTSPENAAQSEALMRADAETTMMLFDQFAGGIEFYFISETPELRGAVNNEIYFEGGKANIALNILLKRFPEPNRLNVYHVAGNVMIQQSRRRRRLHDPKYDFAPPSGARDGFKIEFPPIGMRAPWEPIEGKPAQTFADQKSEFISSPAIPNAIKFVGKLLAEVHAGQRSGAPRSIRDLAKLLRVDQETIYSACEHAGFNINVALQDGGGGIGELKRSDHTVEDLSFDPDAPEIDLQKPAE